MTAVFDFGAFPPEVNSAKMYAGPGSTSMLSSATAWNGLASELRSQAANYASIVSNLTGDSWRGQASTAMAAAAAPYTAWMNTTAAQAEQTASQAMAAAAAYEAAFGMTVSPPVIVANRTQLATLVATNLLGQNGPAIAATEAQYGQMWAQDAAAMYGYAAQSATASKVPSFSTAPQTTAPGALAGQAAAATQAAGTSTQASLSQLTSAVPSTLQGLSSPATSTSSSTSGLSGLESLLSGGSSGNSQLDSFWSTWGPNANIWNTLTSTGTFNPAQIAQTVTSASFLSPGALAGSEGLGHLSPLAAGLGSGTQGIPGITGLGATGTSMSAGLGQAGSIGHLAVPPSWTAAAPSMPSPVASALGNSPLAAPPEVAAGVPGVAPAGMGARAGASTSIADNRFLIRPPMVPSWAAVG
ncbi:PPE family protein [Mycobacterium sp.]|uniref:PPE family protein n=1 Tax=Mycobacterium sp. TaxID=1785 RepID=UPI003BAEABD6